MLIDLKVSLAALQASGATTSPPLGFQESLAVGEQPYQHPLPDPTLGLESAVSPPVPLVPPASRFLIYTPYSSLPLSPHPNILSCDLRASEKSHSFLQNYFYILDSMKLFQNYFYIPE